MQGDTGSVQGRVIRGGEGSPHGSKQGGYTPFFCQESTDHKYHFSGHSVKEFSLGKPMKPRSMKKRDLFKNEESNQSKDSLLHKENTEVFRHLEDLRRIRAEYLKIVESDAAEKARFTQLEHKALAEDVTLTLGDDTRINQSFIHESHAKGGVGATPSKSPQNVKVKTRSGYKQRRDDSSLLIAGSHLANSGEMGDRQIQHLTPERASTRHSESIFLKSADFPKMLKRRKARNYSKVLIPVLVTDDQGEDDQTILDLYTLGKKVREEGDLEYFEGTCLIHHNRRSVLVKRTADQRLLMREIQAQLLFYESEFDFRRRCLHKMRDYFSLRGKYYVVYDKVGEMVSSLDNHQGISDSQLLHMAEDIGRALSAIHGVGLVHAKLNPDSVTFSYDGVADSFSLGVSDFDRCVFESTKHQKVLVDNCSAPELIFGGIGERKSDIWSAGCLLFYIATGKPLFPSSSKSGLAYMMDRLGLDRSSLRALYPMAGQYIERMTEEAKLDIDDAMLVVRELLKDMQVARPQIYQVICECLRMSPQERYVTMTVDHFLIYSLIMTYQMTSSRRELVLCFARVLACNLVFSTVVS